MKKIRVIQNAATFVSDLKVEEIKALQAQNPMALAIEEPNMESGTDIAFLVQFKDNTAFGRINNNEVVFVDKDAEGYACLTILLPANENRGDFLYKNFATTVNLLKTVERKAKAALKNLYTSKDAFANEFIDLDNEVTLAEALEEVDVIVKAPAEKSKKEN